MASHPVVALIVAAMLHCSGRVGAVTGSTPCTCDTVHNPTQGKRSGGIILKIGLTRNKEHLGIIYRVSQKTGEDRTLELEQPLFLFTVTNLVK